MTPALLREYADVMRDTGLTRVALGDGVFLVREVGGSKEELEQTAATIAAIEKAIKDEVDPADPRDNPAAYPDGRAPVFPNFDLTDQENE